MLLAEALTGDRPVRQIRPWLSPRGSVHLYRLLPLFGDGQRARVQRMMTTQPLDVIKMTLVVASAPGSGRWPCGWRGRAGAAAGVAGEAARPRPGTPAGDARALALHHIEAG